MGDVFDIIVPEALVNAVGVAVVISAFVMATIQKLKELPFITKDWHIWFANIVLSFGIGFLMSIAFWNMDNMLGVWIGFFTFIGAPALYEILKNYTPKTLADTEEDIEDLEV